MRKLSVFSTLFLFAFVMAASMAVTLADNAQAGPGNCKTVCVYELVCSTDTGPYCPNPSFPYYMYEMNPYCLGHPELFCPEDVNPPPIGCCASC
jgi:hypothetical protein